jgi:hypothetical protein
MNPQDVQQIVLEVIRRLQAAGSGSSAPLTVTADDEPKQPTTSFASVGGTSGMPVRFAKTKYTPDDPTPRVPNTICEADDGVLVCEERLLTLAKLEHHLGGLRRLIVRRNAVITPALKEELSRRNIPIERDGGRPNTNALFAVSVIRFDADRAPSLHGLGLAEDVHAKSFAVLQNQVNSQLAAGNRHVLVLTQQPATVICVLNRSSCVRAVHVNNVEGVKAAAKAIAANVLVVDPRTLGRVQLAAILRAFENEGQTQPCGELKNILE